MLSFSPLTNVHFPAFATWLEVVVTFACGSGSVAAFGNLGGSPCGTAAARFGTRSGGWKTAVLGATSGVAFATAALGATAVVPLDRAGGWKVMDVGAGVGAGAGARLLGAVAGCALAGAVAPDGNSRRTSNMALIIYIP